MPRLMDLPGSVRLVAALFALMVLGFALLAHVNLRVQDGGGRLPTPDEVLWKYHGKPHSTRLHTVLDPALPEDSALAMWPYLGLEAEEIVTRREQILGWVDAGAPPEGWPLVEPILAAADACGQCHSHEGEKSDVPFTTYEDVLMVTAPDTGMSPSRLLVTAHNHWFGFTVLASLLSLGLCLTRVSGLPRVALILGAFGGAVLDVGGWLLTSTQGAPFQYMVMAGGGLFAASTALMAIAILADAARIRAG